MPLDVEAKVENGVTNALLNLKKQNINWKLSKLTGTSALWPCSDSIYEVHFQGLTKFFKLIGDPESILMLQDRCTANCPSMKVKSLVIYVWWKYYPVHVTLTDLAGKDVLDVTGKIMKCCGNWNDPDKWKSFSTAICCIHKAHKQTGTYVPSCKDCRLMPEEEWFKGCDSHKGHPSILWKGNSTYNNIFTDSMDKIHLDCKEYWRQPTEQMLPCYVWQIHDCLLSSNSMIDMLTFVIVMFSICLFLQFDVFVDIELYHFEQSDLSLIVVGIYKPFV